MEDKLDNNTETRLSVPTEREAIKTLTPKNRVFLQLLLDGKSTLEAYELAGYKGEKHAAYQLRSDLKGELIGMLESQGVDRAGLLNGIKELMQLPLDSNSSQVTVKEKLDILKLLAKILPSNVDVKPAITKFVINTQINNTEPLNVVDSYTIGQVDK